MTAVFFLFCVFKLNFALPDLLKSYCWITCNLIVTSVSINYCTYLLISPPAAYTALSKVGDLSLHFLGLGREALLLWDCWDSVSEIQYTVNLA